MSTSKTPYSGARLLLYQEVSRQMTCPEFYPSERSIQLQTTPAHIYGLSSQNASSDEDEEIDAKPESPPAPTPSKRRHAFHHPKAQKIEIEGRGLDNLHAELYRRRSDQSWCVRDLSQGFGLYVNGQRLPSEDGCRLNHNDVLHIGSRVLRFQLSKGAVKDLDVNEHVVAPPPLREIEAPPSRQGLPIRATLIICGLLFCGFSTGYYLWRRGHDTQKNQVLCDALGQAVRNIDLRSAASYAHALAQNNTSQHADAQCHHHLSAYQLLSEDAQKIEEARKAIARAQFKDAERALGQIPQASRLIDQKLELTSQLHQLQKRQASQADASSSR